MAQNRNTRRRPSVGDELPMGAFRPHPSWYEEHWLRETPRATPGPRRRWHARWAAFTTALTKCRQFAAEHWVGHRPMAKRQDAL